MDPNNPQSVSGPFVSGNTTPPQSGMPTQQPSSPAQPSAPKKSKLVFVVIAAVAVLGLMLVAVLMFGNQKKNTPKTDTTSTDTTQSAGPQPAQAIDVEQINNSINQDISGLNDDQDFPPTQLDDKSLGL